MRKIHNHYFKTFVSIIVVLWFIYFLQTYFFQNQKEGFTPKIQALYRPYIRYIRQTYNKLLNDYGPNVIVTKLKKWNIY